MKTLLLIPLLALPAFAATWSGTPQNSDWNNSANWDGSTPPAPNDNIAFGSSSQYNIGYGGQNTYADITFSNGNNTAYAINIGKGDSLSLNGNGILDTVSRNTSTVGGRIPDPLNTVFIREGGALTLQNQAKLDFIEIVNYEGSITFEDQSSSGKARIFNSAVTASGTPTYITFKDESNAGSSQIINFGSWNSIVRFQDNSSAASARIMSDGEESKIIIQDNAKTETGNFISNGNYSEIRVQDNAVLGNASAGTFTLITSNGTDSNVYIGDNVTSHNVQLKVSGARSQMTITDNFTAYGTAATQFRVESGTRARINIIGNATILSPFTIASSGAVATVYIGGNARFLRSGTFNVGSDGTWGSNVGIISENALFDPTSGTTTLNASGVGSEFYIHGNATIKKSSILSGGNESRVYIGDPEKITIISESTLRPVGIDSSIIIGGLANITQTGLTAVGLQVSGANKNSIIIGGNSTLSSLTVNMASTNADTFIRVQDNADISNTRWVVRQNSIMQIAMNKDTPVSLQDIHQTDGTKKLTILFSGDHDQHLTYNALGSAANSNFTFEQDSDANIRASVTHNASAAITLKNPNTITGELTALQGSINLAHANAASTATLNFTTTGAINFDATLPASLTLGGIAGDGNFAADTRNYEIGANGYDSTFNGTITGSGAITKIGDGVLALAYDAPATSAYTGQIAVQNGTLALSNIDLTNLASPLTVKENAALRIGQGNSNIDTLAIENGAILDVAVTKNNGTVSNGNLYVKDLGGASVIDDIVYRATQNMSISDERLGNGDIISGFLTTNDTNTVTEITTEGGQKNYGKVRSTNTMSFILNSTIVSGNAVLDLEVLTNSLAEYAANPNQAAIAGALDHIIANHPNDPLSQLADTTDDVGAVIDTLNPAGLSSMSRLVYQQTNSEIDVISSRLDMQRHINSALRQNKQVSDAILRVSSSIQSFQVPAAALLVQTKAIPEPGTTLNGKDPLPYQQNSWNSYLAATGSFGKMDTDSRSAGYDYQQAGITLGLDKAIGVNEGIAGLQISYHHGSSDLDKPSEGKVKLNSLRLAGYSGFLTRSGLSVQGHLALSYHDYEAERSSFDHVNGNNTLGTNKGDTKGYGAAVSGELAKIYNLGKTLQWKHGPYARLTYDWLSIKGYDESGTVTSLHIDKQTPDSLRSTLGWKFWYENTNTSGTTLLLSARLGWAHEYSNPNQSISARFAQYDAGFTVRGPDTRRDSLAYGLSAQWLLSSGRFITLQYQGDLNDDQSTHFLNAALGWKW